MAKEDLLRRLQLSSDAARQNSNPAVEESTSGLNGLRGLGQPESSQSPSMPLKDLINPINQAAVSQPSEYGIGELFAPEAYDISSYDDEMLWGYETENIPLSRYAKQSNLMKAVNSVVGGVASGLGTAVEDLAYIFDIPEHIKSFTGEDGVEGNIFSNGAKAYKDWIARVMPIYENPNQPTGFWDSFFRWSTLKSGIDSIVGFAIPGGVVSKAVGLGAKALRGARLGAYLEKLGTAVNSNVLKNIGFGVNKAGQFINYGRPATYINSAVSGVLTNDAEGKMMAIELKENRDREYISQKAKDILKSKYNGDGNYAEQAIREAAEFVQNDLEYQKTVADAQDDFVNKNRLLIASDIFALHGIFRGKGATRSLLKDPSYNTFKKSLTQLNADNPILQMAREGSEEVFQNILQAEGEYQVSKKAGTLSEEDAKRLGDKNLIERAIEFGLSDQALIEGLMGALSGGLQRHITQAAYDVASGDDIRGTKRKANRLAEYQKQQQEIESYTVSSMKDTIMGASLKQAALQNNDEITYDEIADIEFGKKLASSFGMGTAEQLERAINDVANMTQEEALAQGFDENYKEDAIRRLQQLNEAEKEWLKYYGFLNREEIFYNRYIDKNFVDWRESVQQSLNDNLTELNRKYPNLDTGDTEDIARIYDTPEGREVLNLRNQIDNITQAIEFNDKRFNIITSEKYQNTIREEVSKMNEAAEKAAQAQAEAKKEAVKNEVKEAISTADDSIKEKVANNFVEQSEGDPVAQEAVGEALQELGDATEVQSTIDEINTPFSYENINAIVSGINNDRGEYIPTSGREVIEMSSASGTGEIDINAVERRRQKDEVLRALGIEEDEDNTITIAEIDDWVKTNENNKRFNNPTAKTVISRLKDFVKQNKDITENIETIVSTPQVMPDTRVKKSNISKDGDVAQTRSTIEAVHELNNNIEESIAKSNLDPNEPTRLTNGKESINFPYRRTEHAYNSVAYLSLQYNTYFDPLTNNIRRTDSDNELINEEVTKNVLNPNLAKVGTKVTFRVADDDNLEVYNGGLSKVTWGSLKSTLSADEVVNRVPIAIEVDGKPIGYIHDTQWVSEDNIYGNIEEEKAKLSEFRKDILAGKIKGATISRRSDGYLATWSDRQYRPFNESITNPDIKLVINKGGRFIGGDTTLDISGKTPEGYTYMVIPVSNERKIPIPVLRASLNESQVTTIAKAIELFIKSRTGELNASERSVINTLDSSMSSVLDVDQNPIEFNITTYEGIRNFISLYTYLTPAVGMSLANAVEAKPSDYNALSIEENENTLLVSFGKGKGVGIQTLKINKTGANAGRVDAPLTFFDDLREHLRGMYFYSNAKLLEANKNMPIPSISENNVTSVESIKYEDYLKQNVRTSFREFNVGTEENPNYVYFIQPKIEFSVDENITTEPAKSDDTVSLSKFGEIDLSTTAFSDEYYSIGSLTLQDFETFSNAQEGISLITSNVDKVPIGQQHQLIDYIAKDLINQAIDSETLNSERINSTIEEYKSNITQLRDLYSERGNTRVAEHFDEILNKWNNVKRLIFNKLAATGGLTVRVNENSDDIVELVGEESSYERTRFSDSYTLEVDSKDTVSSKMKQFFASIDNPQRLFYINNQPIPESFDIVYNTVQSILANTKPSFDMMISRLQEQQNIPWMPNLINKLLNAPQQIKNEFVVAMNKHYVNMFFAMVSLNDANSTMEVYNTNANSIERTITDSWYNNLTLSPLVTVEDGNYYYSPDEVSAIKDEYKEFLKQAPSRDKLDSWLKKMGIYLSPGTFNSLEKGQFTYRGTQYTYDALFGKDSTLFGSIVSKLNTEGQITDTGNQLLGDSIVKALIALEARNSLRVFSNSHRSGNKTVYSYTNDKYVMDRFFDLKYGDKLIELSSLPFNRESSWLKQMVKDGKIDENSRMYQAFDVNYLALDAFKVKNTNSQDDNDLAHLSTAEHELTKLTMFFNNNSVERGTGSIRTGRFFYPTMSDKTNMFVITAPLYNVNLDNDGSVNNNTVNYVYDNIVQSEINRIIAWRKETNDGKNPINIDAYNEGAPKFLFFPQLNNIDELFITTDEGKRLLRENVLVNEDLQNLIKSNLKDILNVVVSDQQRDWESNNISKKDMDSRFITQLSKRAAVKSDEFLGRLIAADYALNYLIADANIFQLFIGDPALYYKSKSNDYIQQTKDTFINVGKRLAADNAPGMEADFSNISNTYSLAVVRDTKLPSVALEYYKKLGLDSEYEKITGSDAQELTTADEHLDVMYAYGKLSEDEYTQLKDKVRKKEPLDSKELSIVMQPIKPVYVANQIVGDIAKGYGIDVRRYVKSSSFPLFPQLTAGLEIDKVRQAMEDKGIQRLAFESAVKIGAPRVRESIIDKEGNISIDALNNIEPITLSREGFKIQQEVPYHEEDDTINRGTQEAKLLFANIKHIDGFKYKGKEYRGDQLEDVYTNIYRQIFQEKYNQLVEELDYKEVKDVDGTILSYSIDNSKLEAILKEEALSRGYSANDIMGLSLDKYDNFKFPLWSLPSAQNYESLLLSIVDNRVRKIKLPGTPYVLGTQEGFKVIRDADEATRRIENMKNDIVFTSSWTGELLPQRLSDDGSRVLPSQVLVPSKFRDQSGKLIDIKRYAKRNSDGVLMLDEDVMPKELLRIFGFRIPTQGHSSMMGMEIVGFLPVTVGDLCIASRDLTIQMGSDFDVDKLYTYSYSALPVKTESGTKFKKVNDITEDEERYLIDRPQKTSALLDAQLSQLLGIDFEEKSPLAIKKLYNDLLDVHLSVMENPNPELQHAIASPIGFGDLKGGKGERGNLANTVNSWRERRLSTDETFNALSALYQRTKFINATAGKAGVAVFSAAMVFIASAQNKNLYYVEKGNEDTGGKNFFKVAFGDKVSKGDLSSRRTIDGKKLRTKVMEAFQSAAVDNEKEQILDKLNINAYTFNAINALVAMGFDEADIVSLISQDSVFDYVRKKIAYDSQLAEFVEDSTIAARDDVYTALFNRYIESHPGTTLREFKSMANKHTNLSTEEALTYIKQGDELDNYLPVQAAMLDKFIHITEVGQSILAVQSAINTDSKGLGKSFIGSAIKEERIKDLDRVTRTPFNVSGVLNAEQLLGDFKRDPDTEEFLGIDNPTLLGMSVLYALFPANRMFSKLFPYNSLAFQSAVDNIISTLRPTENISASVREKFAATIFKDLKSFLFTNPELLGVTNPNAERRRLLIDEYQNGKITNPSLATIIKRVQETPYGKRNNFINRLTARVNKNGEISRVTYNAAAGSNLDESMIYQGFSDLISKDTIIELGNNNSISSRELAKDLVKYSYLTGGLREAKEFIKFIPIEILNRAGFGDILRATNFNSPDKLGININVDGNSIPTLGAFERQFIQHHPELVSFKFSHSRQGLNELIGQLAIKNVASFKLNGRDSLYSFTPTVESPFFIGRDDAGVLKFAPYIASRVDRNNYLLYMFNGEKYTLVPTLGTFGMMEYQYSGVPTDKFAKTILNRANPDVENSIVVNPVEKEIINKSSDIESVLPIGERKLSINEVFDAVLSLPNGDVDNYISSNPKLAIESGVITEEQLKSLSKDDIRKLDEYIQGLSIAARNMKAAFEKYSDFKEIVLNVTSSDDSILSGSTAIDNKNKRALITIHPTDNWISTQALLLHELTHLLFHDILKESNFDKLTLGQRVAVKRLGAIRELASMYDGYQNTHYGLLNLQEFVAEALTSRRFRDYLNSMNISKEETLWQKMLSVLKLALQRLGILNRIKEEGALRVTEDLIGTLMNDSALREEVALEQKQSLPEMQTELMEESEYMDVLGKVMWGESLNLDSEVSKVKDKFKHCM